MQMRSLCLFSNFEQKVKLFSKKFLQMHFDIAITTRIAFLKEIPKLISKRSDAAYRNHTNYKSNSDYSLPTCIFLYSYLMKDQTQFLCSIIALSTINPIISAFDIVTTAVSGLFFSSNCGEFQLDYWKNFFVCDHQIGCQIRKHSFNVSYQGLNMVNGGTIVPLSSTIKPYLRIFQEHRQKYRAGSIEL